MPVSIRSWPWLAAMLLAGCSASRYEADYTKRVETYEAEAPFAFLQRNPELVEGAASLRLPPDFAVVPKREQRDDGARGPSVRTAFVRSVSLALPETLPRRD